jgi:hypothetical protein
MAHAAAYCGACGYGPCEPGTEGCAGAKQAPDGFETLVRRAAAGLQSVDYDEFGDYYGDSARGALTAAGVPELLDRIADLTRERDEARTRVAELEVLAYG